MKKGKGHTTVVQQDEIEGNGCDGDGEEEVGLGLTQKRKPRHLSPERSMALATAARSVERPRALHQRLAPMTQTNPTAPLQP